VKKKLDASPPALQKGIPWGRKLSPAGESAASTIRLEARVIVTVRAKDQRGITTQEGGKAFGLLDCGLNSTSLLLEVSRMKGVVTEVAPIPHPCPSEKDRSR